MSRRGMLRAVMGKTDGVAILECGHRWTPTPRADGGSYAEQPLRRRCNECGDAKRAAYFRAYDLKRGKVKS